MSVSFFTMVSTIFKYHCRNRRHLRKAFSLHTVSLVIFWITLLVLKVAVYVFGFMNNPGLFWVPMLLKMCLFWLLCHKCKTFKALPHHDKFVFAMASALVPVSVPSNETKDAKALYVVSIFLFLVECLCVLLFAYLIRHFYHFEAFRDFYAKELPLRVHMTFDIFLIFMIVTAVAVILVAIILFTISNNFCHPKRTLFPISVPMEASEDGKSKTDSMTPSEKLQAE